MHGYDTCCNSHTNWGEGYCTKKSVAGKPFLGWRHGWAGHETNFSSLFSLADHLTGTTHLTTPVENGMQAFNSSAIQEPSLANPDSHHCYWNINGERECRTPATPSPCSHGNRVTSDPVLENGHVNHVTSPRRHTSSSTTRSIGSRDPPRTSRSKVPSPARYQLTHKHLPKPPEDSGPDYSDPDGPPTLKAAYSYDKLDRYMSIIPGLIPRPFPSRSQTFPISFPAALMSHSQVSTFEYYSERVKTGRLGTRLYFTQYSHICSDAVD